jgi:hypothetical protein
MERGWRMWCGGPLSRHNLKNMAQSQEPGNHLGASLFVEV